MKKNPVLWFRRMSLVLLVLGLVGGALMVIQGLFLIRSCPPGFYPFYYTGNAELGPMHLCVSDKESFEYDSGTYPQPTVDTGRVGAGVAAILFFLWAYPLSVAVANRLESPHAEGGAPANP
jgi:hypothetical protein